jgi:hypothetical protein
MFTVVLVMKKHCYTNLLISSYLGLLGTVVPFLEASQQTLPTVI